MALQRGPGGKLLRGPTGKLTRDVDCCCNPCIQEYIPCCIKRITWDPIISVPATRDGDGRVIDYRAEVAIADMIGGQFTSGNVAKWRSQWIADEAYSSGWDIWGHGPDDPEDFFVQPPLLPNVQFKLWFENVGEIDTNSSGRIELDAADLQIQVAGIGSGITLPFDAWHTNTPADWTITSGNAISRNLALGDQIQIVADFDASTYRKLTEWPGDPCSPLAQFELDAGGLKTCWKTLGATESGSGPGGTTTSLADCIADVDCECGCDEDEAIACDCDEDATAWNTTSQGEYIEVQDSDPDPGAGDFTIEFEWIRAGSFRDIMWSGERNPIRHVVTLGLGASGVTLNFYYNKTGSVGQISATGSTAFFAISSTSWNTVSIFWDDSAGTIALTINGNTKTSGAVSGLTTHFSPDLSVLGGNVAFGTGTVEDELHTPGCYRNWAIT